MTVHSAGRPRRLRSTAVKFGTVAVLAVALAGCGDSWSDEEDDDDDDGYCSLGTGDRVVAMAPQYVTVVSAPAATAVDALPARGGFGTHLAKPCGS